MNCSIYVVSSLSDSSIDLADFFFRVRNCQDKVCKKENFWKINGDGKFQAFILS